MPEPVVEIVYCLKLEDLLHTVRMQMNSRSKDPLLRVKLMYRVLYCFFTVATLLLLVHCRKHHEAFRTVAPCFALLTAIAWQARVLQKRYVAFYRALRRSAEQQEALVLRAFPKDFTITHPGVSESTTDWTEVRRVEMTPDTLLIHLLKGGAYHVPRRFVSPEQWQAFKTLLEELQHRFL